MSNHLYTDESFFENLFRKYYKALKAYGFKYVDSMDAAEDIVQDVFFELWLKRDQVVIHTQVKSYLFKAVANKSLNYLKSKEKAQRESLEEQHESQIQDSYLKSLATCQEDLLLLNELNEEIKSCVEKLPRQCKRIFILKYNLGMKNKEIAEFLGISIKAVEKQVTKALFEIRSHLQRIGLLSFVIFAVMKVLN